MAELPISGKVWHMWQSLAYVIEFGISGRVWHKRQCLAASGRATHKWQSVAYVAYVAEFGMNDRV